MRKTFWEDGIQFECQGTGRCCTSRGSYGYVYFSLNDRKRMARFLGISTLSFTRKYCKKTNGYFHLKNYKGPCEFLDGKSCSIYEGRPAQCRTWPFWPENMNARTWNREIKSFCPGVGKGRVFTKDEIKELLKLDPIQ
jgi:Fe-S-cluster containining protein